jgi:hypothetical protein
MASFSSRSSTWEGLVVLSCRHPDMFGRPRGPTPANAASGPQSCGRGVWRPSAFEHAVGRDDRQARRRPYRRGAHAGTAQARQDPPLPVIGMPPELSQLGVSRRGPPRGDGTASCRATGGIFELRSCSGASDAAGHPPLLRPTCGAPRTLVVVNLRATTSAPTCDRQRRRLQTSIPPHGNGSAGQARCRVSFGIRTTLCRRRRRLACSARRLRQLRGVVDWGSSPPASTHRLALRRRDLEPAPERNRH